MNLNYFEDFSLNEGLGKWIAEKINTVQAKNFAKIAIQADKMMFDFENIAKKESGIVKQIATTGKAYSSFIKTHYMKLAELTNRYYQKVKVENKKDFDKSVNNIEKAIDVRRKEFIKQIDKYDYYLNMTEHSDKESTFLDSKQSIINKLLDMCDNMEKIS